MSAGLTDFVYGDDKRAEKEAQAEIERQRLEKVMATKDGRWVVWSIISGLGTFLPCSGEYSMGQQAGGMMFRERVRATNIDLYHQMITENDR